jgi:hypothetical protein
MNRARDAAASLYDGLPVLDALLRSSRERATRARVNEPGPGSSSVFVYPGLREAPLGACPLCGVSVWR